MFIGTLSLFDDATHIKCGSKDAVTQFIAGKLREYWYKDLKQYFKSLVELRNTEELSDDAEFDFKEVNNHLLFVEGLDLSVTANCEQLFERYKRCWRFCYNNLYG